MCDCKAHACHCDLASETIDGYLEQAIVGTFRGIYKLLKRTMNPPTSDQLQVLYDKLSINYVNESYRSLILKDDSWACITLGHLVPTHSPRCIMLLLGDVVIHFANKINWSQISFDDLDNFDATLRKQVRSKIKAIRPFLDDKLTHTCTQIIESKLDPNQNLYE
jgi:hypothetical protein